MTAEYRVTDPVKAVTAVTDFEEALYRALQFAFRKSLGTKTLDEILGNKVSVDAEAAEAVRGEMAGIGIEVGEIALKDVILPGEMRDILNQVVSAEKEAQANIIRRREETAATRSLLNTAKVMAENPVMLRLKELEALETISERVGYLTVHNGTQGLLEDLVKLRETRSSRRTQVKPRPQGARLCLLRFLTAIPRFSAQATAGALASAASCFAPSMSRQRESRMHGIGFASEKRE